MDRILKKEYDRKRYLEKKSHYQKLHKKYYFNNRDKLIKYSSDYNKENHLHFNQRMKQWRLVNKRRQEAYNKSRGIKIPIGRICEKCKKELATEKHHPNYDFPKLLIFLCHECHLNEHGRGLKSIE